MAVIEFSHVIAEGALYTPFIKAGALANGDFNNSAPKGARAVDTTNGKLYINTGTLAATVWTVVGAQT
jgi:hypothetical protein